MADACILYPFREVVMHELGLGPIHPLFSYPVAQPMTIHEYRFWITTFAPSCHEVSVYNRLSKLALQLEAGRPAYSALNAVGGPYYGYYDRKMRIAMALRLKYRGNEFDFFFDRAVFLLQEFICNDEPAPFPVEDTLWIERFATQLKFPEISVENPLSDQADEVLDKE